MNIMIYHSSLRNGGAERNIVALANYCVNNDNNVSIVIDGEIENCYLIDSKVSVRTLNHLRDSNTLFSKIHANAKEIRMLKEIICKIKPDIIIGFSPRYALLCKIAKCSIPVIGTERSNPAINRNILDRITVKLSFLLDGFIFQTIGARDFYPNSVQRKSVVICNGIAGDIHNVKDIPFEKRPELSLCATGRLVKEKRYDLIINAMEDIKKKYPNVVLDIYGEGCLKKEIVDMIKSRELEEQVFLRGHSDNIYDRLINYRFFILCSDTEGMPNGLIDAMASGCVCISTDCDFGPRELIENGKNGFLIPCGDSEAMSKLLISLFEEGDILSKVSREAISIRESMSSEKVFKRYYDYMVSCCSQIKECWR